MPGGFPLAFPGFADDESVCGPNLLPNPGFDSGLNGWGEEAGWFGGTAPTWNYTKGRTAAGSLRWTDIGAISYVYSAALVVAPGQHLNASAWTRWGGGAPDWRADIGVTFTNVDDNWLGDIGTTFRDSDSGAGGWAEIATSVVAPANARFARMWLEVRPGTGPGWIDWDDASLCRIGDPFPVPPPILAPVSVGTPSLPVITDNQVISLHTAKGAQLYQFLPEHYSDSQWTRSLRDISTASLSLPTPPGITTMPDIIDWAHWASIYDGDRGTLLWRGPIQKVSFNPRSGLSLDIKDPAAYLSRTRNPITKRWDAADPATIAVELWQAMLDLHNIDAAPIAKADPEGDRFDFQTVTDAQMLDQTMSELVNLGLRWSIVSGVPLLGPVSLKPIAVLHESDFLGDGINLVRDGSAVVNDVLVRGPDNLDRQHADYYGQNLQAIVNLDSMFGVSNVTRAAQQYLRHTATPRMRLELPSGTVLHPNAPVNIDQLMPSARFIIEAHGIQQLMELTSVTVERHSGSATAAVTMETVEEKIELTNTKQAPNVTLGGQQL